ncbi:MAG TPA: efflux RND transporter periplasmic adaptor subunit [Bacteroidota bacterium]|nr:efflux RND transporter periplasmic adaptor subunit [Bacteroidota bacterium]
MKRMYVFVAVAVVVIGSVGYYIIGNGTDNEAIQPVGQMTRIVTVTRGNLDLSVSANGVVQPIDKVEIKSKASGQIEKLEFEEGQLVQKGVLLIELDRRTAQNDYDQAKADLAVAESNLLQAQNNYRRSTELFEKSLISEQEKDQTTVDKVRAEAQLVKAKAVLSTADERLRDTRIVSPITGVILGRSVALGQIISSGTSNVSGGTLLATIADMDEVYVETNVDEVDIGKVQVGHQAKVVADAFPEDTFRGEVIRIAPLGKTQQNVTTFSVIILVRNIGSKLKAGMSASVDIEIFNRRDVLLLPAEALKDPRTEQGRVLMASIREREEANNPKGDSVKPSESTATAPMPTNPDEIRQRMASMSPEEQQKYREQMRQRFQNMSQEERQRLFSQMGRQVGAGGGGGMRRQTQSARPDAPKERIVEVREGDEFVAKVVKVGATNYDFGEILEGLKDGDEVRITTISRAKIAAEAMNERMRNMSGVGGIGGSATRAATGGGRR